MSRKMDKMISEFENMRLLESPMLELEVIIRTMREALKIYQTITENPDENEDEIINFQPELMNLLTKAEVLWDALQELYSDYRVNF